MTTLLTIGAGLLGAFTWTLAEYVLHRWAGHAAKGRTHFSREHLRHHAEAGYFTPHFQKVLVTLVAVLGLTALAAPLLGLGPGVAFTAGFIGAYLTYELVHRYLHTTPPRSAYGRFVRRQHFGHHFMDPRRNHGVTTPLWDWVFRTALAPGRIEVPPKHAMAWLVDDAGAVRPELATDYTLRGR